MYVYIYIYRCMHSCCYGLRFLLLSLNHRCVVFSLSFFEAYPHWSYLAGSDHFGLIDTSRDWCSNGWYQDWRNDFSLDDPKCSVFYGTEGKLDYIIEWVALANGFPECYGFPLGQGSELIWRVGSKYNLTKAATSDNLCQLNCEPTADLSQPTCRLT